jgi:hypothetical protein
VFKNLSALHWCPLNLNAAVPKLWALSMGLGTHNGNVPENSQKDFD